MRGKSVTIKEDGTVVNFDRSSGKFYAYDIINLDTIKEAPQANGFYPALSAPHASSNTLSQDVRMSKQIQEVQDEISDTEEKKNLTGSEKWSQKMPIFGLISTFLELCILAVQKRELIIEEVHIYSFVQ